MASTFTYAMSPKSISLPIANWASPLRGFPCFWFCKSEFHCNSEKYMNHGGWPVWTHGLDQCDETWMNALHKLNFKNQGSYDTYLLIIHIFSLDKLSSLSKITFKIWLEDYVKLSSNHDMQGVHKNIGSIPKI